MLQLLQVLCSLCFVCAARSAASATDKCMANLDLDIVGNDIGDRHGVDSAAACCSVCQEMNGCVAAVHNSEDAVCYFPPSLPRTKIRAICARADHNSLQ